MNIILGLIVALLAYLIAAQFLSSPVPLILAILVFIVVAFYLP
jgi:hypothetical protein